MTISCGDEILSAVSRITPKAVRSSQPALSLKAHPHLLQLMQNPDIGLIDIAESGFHTGAFEPIGFAGNWRRQQTEAREDLPLKSKDTDWKPAEKRPGHRVSTHPRGHRRKVRVGTGHFSAKKALAKGRQLAASALQNRTSATRVSAWTVRYRLSTRRSRLKRSPSTPVP